MESPLGHEKLQVYQRALAFVSWAESALAKLDSNAAVLDHLDRAAESLIENMANGNSRRSLDDRNRFFDIAIGSGLECAACLDVACAKQLISRAPAIEGKAMLQHIVRMTIGLKAARSPAVHEEAEFYRAGQPDQEPALFLHEKLEVYRQSLELVVLVDGLCRGAAIPARHMAALDKNTTSVVLNIAEGNGRYSTMDHRRFLDVAHSCAMNVAARIDLLVAKGCLQPQDLSETKQALGRVVPMLLGLRGYLDGAGGVA